MNNVKLMGADQAATNRSGDNWATSLQVSTAKSKLYTVVVNVPAAIAADRYIWFYDSAAGAVTDANPVFWLHAFYGVTLIQHLEGKHFSNGIYYVVATDEPADATSAPTVASADDAHVSTDFRILH